MTIKPLRQRTLLILTWEIDQMRNVENRRPSDNREQDASRKSKKGTGISEEANLTSTMETTEWI